MACCAPSVESQSETTAVCAAGDGEPASAFAFGSEAGVRSAQQGDETTWEVTVTKGEGEQAKIGLDISHYPNSANGTAIKVKLVKPGLLVSVFNEKNPSKAVKAGDLIIGVNGITGNSADILSTIGKDSELNLILKRSA
mmetsp:Transcript_16130/g.12946  ORF Transcript_16130/g.12946 Transcript_16130/m.12946 type:complete len:139 (-) Transcript_16130:99-515(-)